MIVEKAAEMRRQTLVRDGEGRDRRDVDGGVVAVQTRRRVLVRRSKWRKGISRIKREVLHRATLDTATGGCVRNAPARKKKKKKKGCGSKPTMTADERDRPGKSCSHFRQSLLHPRRDPCRRARLESIDSSASNAMAPLRPPSASNAPTAPNSAAALTLRPRKAPPY